jgi:iron-sulfur cluster insertion protein
VRQLIDEEGDQSLMLRVFVSGRRLLGVPVRVHLRPGREARATPWWRTTGVKLLVDPMSVQYLMGAEIDYTEGLEGSQFVIRNPNASTTCGCGSSFSV